MSTSMTSSSLARSRSLRSNSMKPTSTAPVLAAPSSYSLPSLSLLLANLRLLDLDLREDWPHITVSTFSGKDQKKRIHCVEWALYQLFVLWDPDEAQNKLQPFFPPLEQLQSLNLRAALLRCLENAKKIGVLGRDIILRKTMLDECKGERLEEVLAVFSNAVLKKKVQEDISSQSSVAASLALGSSSYAEERPPLSILILAHKISLKSHLGSKNDARAQYTDFSNLVDLNDRRIARRHEQLKQAIEDRGAPEGITATQVRDIQVQSRNNWSGSEAWLESILHGDSKASNEGILGSDFNKIWKHVEAGSIGDAEASQRIGLLEQLDSRIRSQEARLARWQDFGRTLSKNGAESSSKRKANTTAKKYINLGFDHHQTLQVSRGGSDEVVETSPASVQDYNRLLEKMRTALENVGRTQERVPDQPLIHQEQSSGLTSSSPISSFPESESEQQTRDAEWSSIGEEEQEAYPVVGGFTQSSLPAADVPVRMVDRSCARNSLEPVPQLFEGSSTNPELAIVSREESIDRDHRTRPSNLGDTHESAERELADEILKSVSASSPSPKKPRHTLSLAERTRLSMSRTSISKFSDLEDASDEYAPLPSISSMPPPAARSVSQETSEDKHAALIERTRRSMAGFEAAQKKAQAERRKSLKDARKKQRESSYFAKVEEEPVTPTVDPVELIEADPDYESVFKSRPKIKTSPRASPTRILEDESED